MRRVGLTWLMPSRYSGLDTPRGSPHKLPSSTPSSSSPSGSACRIALKFDGHVYRTLDPLPGAAAYSTMGDFLGQPDEQVGEAERERGDSRRLALELQMLVEKSATATPPQRRRPPVRHPEPPRALSLTLRSPALGLPFLASKPLFSSGAAKPPWAAAAPPVRSTLPAPLASLLSLYYALEAALVAHLAGDGSALASSTSTRTAEGERTIRIPKLLDFFQLQSLLSSGGKQFGLQELAQLLWVWQGCGLTEFSAPDTATSDDELVVGVPGARSEHERGGLGFIVSTTRTKGLDNKLVLTHALGISLIVRSNPQLPAFSLVPTSPRRVPLGARPRSSPRSSPAAAPQYSPPSAGRGRESMSTVALWSQGSEHRRAEVAHRLMTWAAGYPVQSLPPLPVAQLPPLTFSTGVSVPGSISPAKRPRDSVPALLHSTPLFSTPLAPASGPQLSSTQQRSKALLARVSLALFHVC